MKKILCPKCGMEAIGGSGFWGTTKPYCSFCGWNLDLAKQSERNSLRKLPWGFVFILIFCLFAGYSSKSAFSFPVFFFLFLSLVLLVSTLMSWRRLRIMEASHPSAAYASALPSLTNAKENNRQSRASAYQYLWELTKPRAVRFRPVARVITIAFPISGIALAYFGYQIVENQIRAGSRSTNLSYLSDLGFPLFFVLIWSVIGITTIRSARRDRRPGRRRPRHGHHHSPRT